MKKYIIGRNSEKGFTLIEIMIVIAIIAVIAFAAMQWQKTTETANNVNALSNFINVGHSTAVAWKRQTGRSSYTGASYTVITGEASGTGANPLGGNAAFAAGTITTEFVETLTAIPANEGVRMADGYGSSYTTAQKGAKAVYTSGSQTLVVTFQN